MASLEDSRIATLQQRLKEASHLTGAEAEEYIERTFGPDVARFARAGAGLFALFLGENVAKVESSRRIATNVHDEQQENS